MKRITVPAVCLALVLLVSSAFLAGPSPALANGFTDDADAIEKAAQAVICWVEHGPREAMQRFNHKPNKKKKQENGKTDQPDGAVGDPAGPAGC